MRIFAEAAAPDRPAARVRAGWQPLPRQPTSGLYDVLAERRASSSSIRFVVVRRPCHFVSTSSTLLSSRLAARAPIFASVAAALIKHYFGRSHAHDACRRSRLVRLPYPCLRIPFDHRALLSIFTEIWISHLA